MDTAVNAGQSFAGLSRDGDGVYCYSCSKPGTKRVMASTAAMAILRVAKVEAVALVPQAVVLPAVTVNNPWPLGRKL